MEALAQRLQAATVTELVEILAAAEPRQPDLIYLEISDRVNASNDL